MDQIIRQLQQSKHILVTSHTNPDGDAIGTLLAMGLALEQLDKHVTLLNESPIPAVYRFLPTVHRVRRSLAGQRHDSFDTAVVVDCSDLNRIGRSSSTVVRIPVIVNLDHHITNSGFGHLQYIDTGACASAEIVYDLACRMNVAISMGMATAIYTGILTDTGSFRFSNTTRRSFTICEEMIERGVDPSAVAKHVYGTYSLGRIKLLNLALDSIEISSNGKLSLMSVTREMLAQTETYPEDADGLINYAKRIRDVKVAVLMQEANNGAGGSNSNKYHVSLRSDGTVDVGAIAAAYGGGGHASAAGFSIESNMIKLKNQIFNLAENI